MPSDCGWSEIDAFRSLKDYEEHLNHINEQVSSGSAKSVELDPKQRWGTAFDERWFTCGDGSTIWRLVAPDPPFRGIFKVLR